jgi:hypothetical protein
MADMDVVKRDGNVTNRSMLHSRSMLHIGLCYIQGQTSDAMSNDRGSDVIFSS